MNRVEFRLLGPVEAAREGTRLPLGGRKQRLLLALLLLEPGRPVSSDTLVDELWRGEAPAGASVTLRSYVSRLRNVLGSDVSIDFAASGYVIDVSPAQIDALEFERLIREGRDAQQRGADGRAVERLRAALALWRGRPFGDVGDDGALRLEGERLEEVRLHAIEQRVDSDLALGAGVELVDELETLVGHYPHRERFWGQLMLALYRAERQADALATYHRARTLLVGELGLDPGADLQRLEQAILRQDVGLLPRPGSRSNLPAPVTGFIGRDRELADLERLVSENRLVTLTGVGGVGKTRLALEAAARALPDFRDGVFFVDLSGLTDSALITRSIALALDMQGAGDAGVADRLIARLRGATILLILDNCEHLRDACAEVTHSLLSESKRLRILATSREVLDAPGEADYVVPPLGLPAAGADQEGLLGSEAVQLFLARAAAARSHRVLDARAVATAARICSDLDGLPLAIELAAARTRALSFDDIAARLSDRFRFLVSWRRLSAARHRTLREAMDWSFELLASDEQALLTRISVFAGDFTLAAAAMICLDGDEERALGLIERLVAASLVVPDERAGVMSYRLLETVRQYAAERLDPSAAEQTRRAHARYFLKVAQSADLTALRRRREERLDIAIAAQDNLRSALAWSIASGSVEFGIELATALERFWVTHDPNEGIRWFGTLLDHPESAALGAELRANALRAYGGAMDIAGRDADAERLWRESLALFDQLGDESGRAMMLHRLAISAMRRGDLAGARELDEACLEIHERTGNRSGLAQAIGTLGAIHRDEGDESRAFELMARSATLAREHGSHWWESGMLAELANLSLNAGQIDEAERQARASLSLAEQMGDRAGRVFAVGLLARVALERGQHESATRLWAAVEREDAGAPLGGWRRHRETYRSHIGGDIGEEATGSAKLPRLTLDEAVALALEPPAARARTPRAAGRASAAPKHSI